MTQHRRPTSNETFDPAASAFRMPAEWEPHAATWLAWPHYHGDWPGKFEPIPWVYAEIIRSLARHERVELIVSHAASEKQAKKLLDRANALSPNVRFHRWPTDRVWTRDSGCTFVHATGPLETAGLDPSVERSSAGPRRGQRHSAIATRGGDARISIGHLAAVEWRFNAWAKYSNWRNDQKIGCLMAQAAGADEIRAVFGTQPVVLEGGSIEVNGRGTLLATEECLLSKVQQRNPGMKRADYARLFADSLGINHVVWLASGIVGDDTHGHIDDLTRFVAPDTVVTVVESNPRDANYQALRENLRRLRESTDQAGRPLVVIELPMPAPVIFDKRRLPASYANFYVANGLVLVPVFNDPNDRFALDILAGLFPDREVVGVYCGDLVWGLGTIHCMTQQEPKTHIPL
jgi:agmatine deiminase